MGSNTDVNAGATVVFADMTGSTALYEALGNEGAAAVVAPLTQAMGACMQRHGGRVVKNLGDGVLGLFTEPGPAVLAAAAMMREYRQWISPQAQLSQVAIHIGLASGEVVEVDGDCYGDAVNVAARLCERADAAEIWASESVVAGLRAPQGMSFVRLGHLDIRGKAERLVTYQVEWRTEDRSDRTVHAELRSDMAALVEMETCPAQIQLSWPGAHRLFSSAEVPVNVGRAPDSHLCIADPRVSRVHARLEWQRGAFVLTDLSSFGTWVRFDDSEAPVPLRRDSCLLHGTGEIALGVPFVDGSASTIGFRITGSSLRQR
ncbi:MAG: adenylate/guanylate cyclase domain-containing protein [Proteobacteria bacterium]|nr:adenylate/guanylate cyclase domain-containing protein [Pseudomonadota bacterium]